MEYNKLYNSWKSFTAAGTHKKKQKSILGEAQLQEAFGQALEFSFEPNTFLKLTTNNEILASIKDEVAADDKRNFPLPTSVIPTLNVELQNGVATIKGHDGRHRTWRLIRDLKIDKLTVQVLVDNIENPKIEDIKAFVGQFANPGERPPVVQVGNNIKPIGAVTAGEDPLRLSGKPAIEIPGYDMEENYEKVGIKHTLRTVYNKKPTGDRIKFSEILNNAYNISDSNGKSYRIAFKRADVPDRVTGKLYNAGLIEFNLFDDAGKTPFELYGAKGANELKYIISKKTA